MRTPMEKRSVRRFLMGTTVAIIGAAGLMMPLQGLAQTQAAPSVAWTQPANLADLIETVSPAVVKITASGSQKAAASDRERARPETLPPGPMGDLFRRFLDENPGGPAHPSEPDNAQYMGSGFIISGDGVIVTNNHVVEGRTKLVVTLKDGREFEARVLGTDPKTDLAVLKIETAQTLPSVAWGDSDKARIGDPVFAVGAPFGLSGSVTSGIISARGREIGSGPYDDFIQVDAPINKGNSGGPLFDRQGNVVGVNTAILSPSGGSVGIGFSIPSKLANSIVSEIMDTGSVERGWLGVRIQNISGDIAESLGLANAEGVIVDNVEPDSPAQAAGLKSGDVILAFDEVNIVDVGDLTLAVADAKIGTGSEVKVFRDGNTLILTPKIALLENIVAVSADNTTPVPDYNFESLGLALESEGDQVIVIAVQPDSAAASAKLREGDILVSVNQKPMATLADVSEAVDKARELDRPSILLQVERQGGRVFLTIPLSASS